MKAIPEVTSARLMPARPDLVVRDPITHQPLPADGAVVELTDHWYRRLADGDVVPAPAPARTPVVKATSKTTQGTAQ